jgi:hypothetical protein
MLWAAGNTMVHRNIVIASQRVQKGITSIQSLKMKPSDPADDVYKLKSILPEQLGLDHQEVGREIGSSVLLNFRFYYYSYISLCNLLVKMREQI